MARRVADLVYETSTTTGTGTLTLLGAQPGYRSLLSGIGASGNTWYYAEHDSNTEWEIGYGSIDPGGTALGRNAWRSSNGNALVDFSAGTKNVRLVEPSIVIDPVTLYVNSGDDIQSVIDMLPSDGGRVVVLPGTYTLSDAILLPDNIVFELRAGAEIKPQNSYAPTSTVTINTSRVVYSLIRNADDTNGNTNITITGQGRVHSESVTGIDENKTWAGVFLHKCSDCVVEGIEVDHIVYAPSEEGGPGTDERFFCVFFTECTNCHMFRLHAHHSGDDTLGIRRTSTKCSIVNCYVHNCSYGHPIQVATSTVYGDVGGVKCDQILIHGNWVHDAEGLGETEGGIALHSVHNSTVSNNHTKDTGHGIFIIGDSQGNKVIGNTIISPRWAGITVWAASDFSHSDHLITGNFIELNHAKPASQNFMAGIYLRLVNDEDLDGIHISDNYVQCTSGANGDLQCGVWIENTGVNTCQDVNISGLTVKNAGWGAVYLDTRTSSSAIIRRVTVSNVHAISCGYGLVAWAQDSSTIEDVQVSGGQIFSNRLIGNGAVESRGVRFNTANNCSCVGVRCDVSGIAFSDTGGNWNRFSGNNARNSATSYDVTGTNSSVERTGKGSDVASADEITVGDEEYFDVTGTTTINHINKTGWTAGATITLQFDSTPTVTHNAGTPTGTEASVLLMAGVNFVATPNDTLTLVYDGTTFREIGRSVN